MAKVVSIPNKSGSDSTGQEEQFGYVETINLRQEQEDALSWHTLTSQDLTPKNASKQLTPKEIGHRLWASYQLLDQKTFKGGTTASTTVYDGKGNLITATLADAAAFAALYDKNGQVLGVMRLNTITHKPTDSAEAARIQKAGGFVKYGRVNGILAVSRAIGDSSLKRSGVCADATIDITHVEEIVAKLQINPDDIGKIHIISTCDGFTDGAGKQTKNGHEEYLFSALKKINAPGNVKEKDLAQKLVNVAQSAGSTDNISVAIQTITSETPPFLLGVYDGHGGNDASIHVAQNIANVFTEQCRLEFKAIVEELSKLSQGYLNSLDLEKAEAKQAKVILDDLIKILHKKENSYEDRVQQFYLHLDKQAASGHSETERHVLPSKNIDLLKKDTSVSALNFAIGIGSIAVIVGTGVVLGLLISLIVYAATSRHVLDLFKPNSDRYEKDIDLIKQRHRLDSFFSNPDYSAHDKDDDLDKLEQAAIKF